MIVTIKNSEVLESTHPFTLAEEFQDIETCKEMHEMGEETFDFEEIEDEVVESMMYAFDNGIIHPSEYGDEWEVFI